MEERLLFAETRTAGVSLPLTAVDCETGSVVFAAGVRNSSPFSRDNETS